MTAGHDGRRFALAESDLERDLILPEQVQPRMGVVRTVVLALVVVAGAASGALGLGYAEDYPEDRGFAVTVAVLGAVVWLMGVVVLGVRTHRHVRAVARRRSDLKTAFEDAASADAGRTWTRDELSGVLSSARSDSASAIGGSQFPGLLPSICVGGLAATVAILIAAGIDAAMPGIVALAVGWVPLLAVAVALSWSRLTCAYLVRQLPLRRERALSDIARERFPNDDEDLGGPTRAVRLLRDPRMLLVGIGLLVLVLVLVL